MRELSPTPLGLYIHVPFCAGKCPYCDFYSLPPAGAVMDEYLARVKELLARYGSCCGRTLSTVYFGGGTPSLLGAGRLCELLDAAARHFTIAPDTEITCEANPTGLDGGFFSELRAGGFNRLSMGMQSAVPEELRLLGRRHSPGDVRHAVELARAGGFENLSLDLMLALPGSTQESLGRSIQFAAGLEPEHLSAYLLKVEPGTPFAARDVHPLDGDAAAEQYLFCVEELARHGYVQYEISNFARPGRESRHNLLYWRCEEYLGLGPGAHSFYEGRRFYWPRDLKLFLAGGEPVDDGPGGDPEDFAMLKLRLAEGLSLEDCARRYGQEGERFFSGLLKRAARCPKDLLQTDAERLRMTPQGFLVSNALLARLLG